jgi:hypothetical protein
VEIRDIGPEAERGTDPAADSARPGAADGEW